MSNMDGHPNPGRTNRQAVLSPFSFLQNADEPIVNIVHSTIRANLPVVSKNNMIIEALSKEQGNGYWSWKLEIARQVPEEVLRFIPEPDKGYVLYYVKHDKLNKALSICAQYSAEAAHILQKWNNKVNRSEEWMDVVFDSAAKTLAKWTQKMEEQKQWSNPSDKIGSMGNNVKEYEKVEQRTTDHSSSRSSSRDDRTRFTNESQPRAKDTVTPRAHNIDEDDINEDKNDIHKGTPVPHIRKNKNPHYTSDEEESATQKKVSDIEKCEVLENPPVRPPRNTKKPQEYNFTGETHSSSAFQKTSEKGTETGRSLHPSLDNTSASRNDMAETKLENSEQPKTDEQDERIKSNGVSIVSKRPTETPLSSQLRHGNQSILSDIQQQCLAKFGTLNPPPGTTVSVTTKTTVSMTTPLGTSGIRISGIDEVIVPVHQATVQEINDDGNNMEHQAFNLKIEDKKQHIQENVAQPDDSAKKPVEFEKFNNIKALNILLLGETGVGKTTFVNSLANYLKYETLEEALVGEPLVLVDASFVQGFENGTSTTVHVSSNSGKHMNTIGLNEHINDKGASCTQSTVEHVFKWKDGEENKLVRIIDTPGINDTRGPEKDKENLENIMKHIAEIGELHAICILMKPNEAKLNHSFRSCIDYLLMNLHRSATTNILFCFTMTRSNMYRPGDSLSTLRIYLNNLERDTGVLIKADSSNLFSFENDCFRYMCAVRQIPELKTSFNMKTFSEGWRHNVPECIKMFKRVQGLAPHAVEDTVSINETRRLIQNIVRPLADLARNHLVNMRLLQEYIDTVANPNQDGNYLASQVYQEQVVLNTELLPFPQTVCNSWQCTELIQVNKYEKRSVPKVCHVNCALTTVIEGRSHEKELKYCSMFRYGNGYCEACGCHWSNHVHSKYKLKYETKMVVDQAAKMRMDNFNDRERAKETILAEQKEKLHQMELENDQIRDCCAEMAAFLEKNSMRQGCDPYNDHLKQLLEEETIKCEMGQASFEMAVALDTLQSSYNKRVEYILKEINSGRRNALSTAELNGMIDALCHMKYAGSTFARLRDIQMSTIASAPLEPPTDLLRENPGVSRASDNKPLQDNTFYRF